MNLGLLNGLSGEALRFFLLDDKNSHQKGCDLLDIIAEKIFVCEDYSFNNGIIGFGWLIAFLHQEKYIRINSDEVLEEFDDQIYKVALSNLGEKEKKINELLGLTNYFLIRHRNTNPKEKYFRKFIHSECLNLIFNNFVNYIEACIYKKDMTNSEFYYGCKILLKLSYSNQYIFDKNLQDKLIDFHIYYIQFVDQKLSKDYKSINLTCFLYLLLSIMQQEYRIFERRMSLLGENLTHLLLDNYIYKLYSSNYLQYHSLQNNELLFLLTNYEFKNYTLS
ncbi:hypothetical protein [Chryseobacterium sp.]|uniref:hypothetical protein n=1 Tax=Chryseobacterium sp. TaxID=1871047 RepID=UPI0028A189EE|nr:hypothetical protein [Chryseobacterium sp.]